MRFPAKKTSSCIWVPYLLIELFYIGIPVRTFSRSVGRWTVTWSPNFLGWVDLLSYGAPHARASSAMKGNSKRPSGTSLSMLWAQNKHLGAALQTLLTKVKLRLRRRLLFTQHPVLQFFEFIGALRASWVFMVFFRLSSNWVVRNPPRLFTGISVDFTSTGFKGGAVLHATSLDWRAIEQPSHKIYTFSCSLNFYTFTSFFYVCLILIYVFYLFRSLNTCHD